MADYLRNEDGDVLYDATTGNLWHKSEPHLAFTSSAGWQYDNCYPTPPAWAGNLVKATAHFVKSVFAI